MQRSDDEMDLEEEFTNEINEKHVENEINIIKLKVYF